MCWTELEDDSCGIVSSNLPRFFYICFSNLLAADSSFSNCSFLFKRIPTGFYNFSCVSFSKDSALSKNLIFWLQSHKFYICNPFQVTGSFWFPFAHKINNLPKLHKYPIFHSTHKLVMWSAVAWTLSQLVYAHSNPGGERQLPNFSRRE